MSLDYRPLFAYGRDMSSIRNLIEELGGISAVARRIDSKPQTVHSWIVRGSIPAKHWGRLEKLCGVKWKRLREIANEPETKLQAAE